MNYQHLKNYRERALVQLIREVSILNGGDDDVFLDEYIIEVLKKWADDLQSAIVCFESLKAQAIALGKTLEKPKPKPIEKRHYHPAFREYYERQQ
jgi:hypothetical protein